MCDVKLEKKLDKDRFRKDLGNIIQGYQEVARRLSIMPEGTNISEVNFGKTTSIKFKKSKLKFSVTVTLKERCARSARKSCAKDLAKPWDGEY